MIAIPREYVVLKFFELGYYPKTNKFNDTYQCSCPICREGKSLGKKRRCYYIPENDNIYCHNCGWSGKPFNWIREVSGKSDFEIIEEIKAFSPESNTALEEPNISKKNFKSSTLPVDCINLNDENQVSYYKGNDIVRICNQVILSRKLNTAINKPKNLYLSLTDRVHKNRLIIPFNNESSDIEFYQSRTILPSDGKIKPKYLSKIGAEKTLFNIDQVSSDHDTVYIFEGPLNAFFTKNSVAVAGITEGKQSFTPRQKQQLDSTLKFYEKVWVLDSQWVDNASLSKSETLLKQDQRVFIWPEKFGTKFKDFNDIAIKCNINEINHNFLQKNTFEGLEGIIRLSEIKKSRRI